MSGPRKLTAQDIKSRLLSLQRLSVPAINSAGERKKLLDGWSELQRELPKQCLSGLDSQLLSDMIHSHRILAEQMVQAEDLLQEVLHQSKKIDDPHVTSIQLDCPLRTWMYRNILFPFPDMPDRRQLQSETQMSMSNINGWYSNIRRRCGWNTMCTKWAQGDRLKMREMMIGCFTGEVRDEVLMREIRDVIDYIMGKTKGRVGSWLTEIVGDNTPNLNRFTGIRLDYAPQRKHDAAASKRRKIDRHMDYAYPTVRVHDERSDDSEAEDEDDDDESAVLEVNVEHMQHVTTLGPQQIFHPGTHGQGYISHPHRSFSGSSEGSTISNISTHLNSHSRVPSTDYSQLSGSQSQYTPSPHNGHRSTLPIVFGGPPQQFAFQPELPAMDRSRRPKRAMQDMEEDEPEMRSYKVARRG